MDIDRIPKKIFKIVKEWAYESFDIGHPMDSDDFEEFKQILMESLEDTKYKNLKLSDEEFHHLFNYYYEMFDEASEEADVW